MRTVKSVTPKRVAPGNHSTTASGCQSFDGSTRWQYFFEVMTEEFVTCNYAYTESPDFRIW